MSVERVLEGRRLGDPQRISADLADAIRRGDIRGAGECFSRNGCLVTPDDTAVYGREAIVDLLRQLNANVVDLEIDRVRAIAGEEMALSSERWTLRFESPEGSYRRSSLALLVIKRVEGLWKIAIAAPWGWPRVEDQLVARPMASSGNESIRPM